MTDMLDDSQRPEYFAWVNEQLGESFQYGGSTKCLASLYPDGRIRGVAVYDFITPHGCNMHIASDKSGRFLTRDFLRWAFRIPFEQWNLKRTTALVRAGNEKALRFTRHLGFVYEGTLRQAFGDEDAIVLGMLRSECRFLGEHHG